MRWISGSFYHAGLWRYENCSRSPSFLCRCVIVLATTSIDRRWKRFSKWALKMEFSMNWHALLNIWEKNDLPASVNYISFHRTSDVRFQNVERWHFLLIHLKATQHICGYSKYLANLKEPHIILMATKSPKHCSMFTLQMIRLFFRMLWTLFFRKRRKFNLGTFT